VLCLAVSRRSAGTEYSPSRVLFSDCSAPIAVVPGRFAVTRMQTFAQVWWQLLRCPLRVVGSGQSALDCRLQEAVVKWCLMRLATAGAWVWARS
jgi:hypothetical protein